MICTKLPAKSLSLLFKGRYSLIKSVIVMESRRNLPRKAREDALIRLEEEKSALSNKVPAKKRGGENPDEAVAKKGEKPVKNDEKPSNGAVSKRAKAKHANGDKAEAATEPKAGKSKTDDDIAPKRKEKPKVRRSKSVELAPVSKPAKKARKAEEPLFEELAKKPRGKKTPSVEPEQPTTNSRSRKKTNPTPEKEEEEEVPAKKSKAKKMSPEKGEDEAEPTKKSKSKHTSSAVKGEDEEVPAKKSKAKKTSPEKDEEEAEPSKRSRAKQTTSNAGTDEDDAEPTKKTKGKKKGAETNGEDSNGKGEKLANKTETDYGNIDFSIKEKFNLKIATWNVAGLRALVKKNPDYIVHENADIVCLNEIKCMEDEIPEEYKVQGYHVYWNNGKGEGGVGILSKVKPISVVNDLPDTEFADAKRMITAEYKNFYLVCVYVVNAGRGLKTLDKRMEWNIEFDNHIKALDGKKPVIIAGDMNVSHQEIDLANPKSNKKNAGFTQEERDGFTQLLSLGFVDTFRHFHPDKEGAYTFWSYMSNARSKNTGWRLDYFLASKRLMKHVKANVIRSTVLGSDHCPVVLFLDL